MYFASGARSPEIKIIAIDIELGKRLLIYQIYNLELKL